MKVTTMILLSALAVASVLLVAWPADGQAGSVAVEKAENYPKSFASPPPVGTKATCPVMGTQFEVKKDTQRSEYQGRHYVFCCPMCKPKFDANPKKYADNPR